MIQYTNFIKFIDQIRTHELSYDWPHKTDKPSFQIIYLIGFSKDQIKSIPCTRYLASKMRKYVIYILYSLPNIYKYTISKSKIHTADTFVGYNGEPVYFVHRDLTIMSVGCIWIWFYPKYPERKLYTTSSLKTRLKIPPLAKTKSCEEHNYHWFREWLVACLLSIRYNGLASKRHSFTIKRLATNWRKDIIWINLIQFIVAYIRHWESLAIYTHF